MRCIVPLFTACMVLALSPASAQDAEEKPNEIQLFADRLCSRVEMSYGFEDAHIKAEDVFLRFSGLSRDDKPEEIQRRLQTLWAEHGDQLVCRNKSLVKPWIRTPQAFLKRVVDMSMDDQILNEWLFESRHPIDVNAVQYVDGKPETLLDYLNAILADEAKHDYYDFNEIIRLRYHIVTNFDAKTAADLGL